jgi:hypothetical protein
VTSEQTTGELMHDVLGMSSEEEKGHGKEEGEEQGVRRTGSAATDQQHVLF